jgi:hypothetical protein
MREPRRIGHERTKESCKAVFWVIHVLFAYLFLYLHRTANAQRPRQLSLNLHLNQRHDFQIHALGSTFLFVVSLTHPLRGSELIGPGCIL